ncbi:MAG: OsmC family protein [Candidatus Dormibacteraeota bacterium]|nr:OsmC family protein [Candidatus Dormibacteraeota bacterium]
MAANDGRLAAAHLDSGATRYAQTIRVGHHTLTSDEPPALGGGDAGPSPYGLLLASLAACTSITLAMYAAKKEWELGPVHVELGVVPISVES